MKLRITYLHQYFNTPSMAGGTRSYELGRRLVAMGHAVNMVTSAQNAEDQRGWFESEEAGMRVHWMPVPYSNRMSYRERIRAFIRFAYQSASKAASLDADVIFATSTPLTICMPAVYAAKRLNVPMVFEVRDLWPDVPHAMGCLENGVLWHAALLLEKFAYKSAQHIVALTPTMRDFISGKGIPLERVSVIPNMAETSLFRPTKEAKPVEPKMILYCGSLGPSHGPMFLVELAREFYRTDTGICLEVVGDGKLRAQMEKAAKAGGFFNKSITFHGPVAKAQVPAFYNRAHASLLTFDDYELLYRHSVQNKFFDSMAAGVPVIANYRGYASELAECVGAGIIIDRNDLKGAGLQTREFLNNEHRLAQAAISARALAEEQFDADSLAKKLEAILKAQLA